MGFSRYSFVNSFRTWLHHRRLRKANPQHGFTVVVNAHREGTYLAAALRSAMTAAQPLLSQGVPVELLVVMDRPDQITSVVAQKILKKCSMPKRILRLNVGDLGLARNAAVKAARFPWIAFLDGDDLWAANWLTAARSILQGADNPDCLILHPRYTFYFELEHGVLHIPDQSELSHPLAQLVADNFWNSLCIAHDTVFKACPYNPKRLVQGLGYEDWSWNRHTVLAGFEHRGVDGTCHYKRQRVGSLCRKRDQADALATP